jgi:hypothetical protein
MIDAIGIAIGKYPNLVYTGELSGERLLLVPRQRHMILDRSCSRVGGLANFVRQSAVSFLSRALTKITSRMSTLAWLLNIA